MMGVRGVRGKALAEERRQARAKSLSELPALGVSLLVALSDGPRKH